MKIIQFSAENIKKLRAVEIKPSGEIVTIAGRNAQGKSSVLDSIWWALAGTAAIQGQPIRKGETKARVRLDLGEIVVERRFTEKGSTLTVENADGARFPSPQKMLDALLGELSFDPLAFARMEPRRQFDELRRISKLAIDIDELDALNRGDYAKRTDINRDAKAKRATAEAIKVADGLPAEPIDERALLDRIEEAGQHNADIERRKARRAEVARQAQAFEDAIPQHETRIAELEAKIIEERKAIADCRAKAAEQRDRLANAGDLPAPIDAAAVRAQLDQARATNQAIARRAERDRISAEAAALEKQSDALTEQMAAREKAKTDAIAKAKMPVLGLGFGSGVVTYQGVPLEQASSAEQLRVSLAIAMAANPKLRVIRIQDGSLLDEDSLAAIAMMAKEGDYQVWLEKVGNSNVGVVIEDGSVSAVDGVPVEKAAA